MSGKSASRPRGPNFTKEEQFLLFNTVQPFCSIIECKKTDSVRQVDKQNAWSRITENFNANSKGAPRSVENLISCYRNVKSKFKKQHSEAKMMLKDSGKDLINAVEEHGEDWEEISSTMNQPIEVCRNSFENLKKQLKKEDTQRKSVIMGTGGGPPPPNDEGEPLNKLRKFIEPQMDGLFTIYDGDANIMAQYQASLPKEDQRTPIEHNLKSVSAGTSDTIKDYVNYNEIIIDDHLAVLTTPNKSKLTSRDEHETGSGKPSTSDIHTMKQENEIHTSPNFKDLTRTEILRKKKPTELMRTNDTRKKTTVNDSFQDLAMEKIKLVREQQRLCQIETEHKRKLFEIELEEKLLEKQFNAEMRAKQLLLIDLKIKKEGSMIESGGSSVV
ncbi:uncharacterized protein LOC125491413 isoform X3 [Plutella xylostella]|uniref:uncharacterized protein LOC125489085 isoform X2 n=1 Tax=Plutella xylostella TaxID=51655 RepID=UPI00203238AC|nr:uncharacterized protein LOC125489085 isoform X2 [Plutella xylostella]XP_048479670.1 uncharacterized protein LOC125489085 isoform X3 [Plutella xylostella]XP_048489272.1 uncharacterized protein LOC125491413 isoform X2 [Plutella xylostella]XP_048489273.1 uncharacterized protein LOC125491413 isoform X3 [Plutella xylostella]